MPAVPTQESTDLSKPEEHLMWVLQNMPMMAGTGAITAQPILKVIAKHLWETGTAHRDYLESLADENGNIHVSKLPKQHKKFIPPVRGPRHGFNNASRWVGMNEHSPAPMVVQDPRSLTAQEREAQLSIYREMGAIPEYRPGRDTATVEY